MAPLWLSNREQRDGGSEVFKVHSGQHWGFHGPEPLNFGQLRSYYNHSKVVTDHRPGPNMILRDRRHS